MRPTQTRVTGNRGGIPPPGPVRYSPGIKYRMLVGTPFWSRTARPPAGSVGPVGPGAVEDWAAAGAKEVLVAVAAAGAMVPVTLPSWGVAEAEAGPRAGPVALGDWVVGAAKERRGATAGPRDGAGMRLAAQSTTSPRSSMRRRTSTSPTRCRPASEGSVTVLTARLARDPPVPAVSRGLGAGAVMEASMGTPRTKPRTAPQGRTGPQVRRAPPAPWAKAAARAWRCIRTGIESGWEVGVHAPTAGHEAAASARECWHAVVPLQGRSVS